MCTRSRPIASKAPSPGSPFKAPSIRSRFKVLDRIFTGSGSDTALLVCAGDRLAVLDFWNMSEADLAEWLTAFEVDYDRAGLTGIMRYLWDKARRFEPNIVAEQRRRMAHDLGRVPTEQPA